MIGVKGDPLSDPGLFGDERNVSVVVQGGRVVKDLEGRLS